VCASVGALRLVDDAGPPLLLLSFSLLHPRLRVTKRILCNWVLLVAPAWQRVCRRRTLTPRVHPPPPSSLSCFIEKR
jgi:hypothetical protein